MEFCLENKDMLTRQRNASQKLMFPGCDLFILSCRENNLDMHKEFSFLELHCLAYFYYTTIGMRIF